MADQLAQLTPENRHQLMLAAQQQANEQIMQGMITKMSKSCFDKCAGTSGDRLDSREQACMAACQDRYLETRAQVQAALQKRQDRG